MGFVFRAPVPFFGRSAGHETHGWRDIKEKMSCQVTIYREVLPRKGKIVIIKCNLQSETGIFVILCLIKRRIFKRLKEKSCRLKNVMSYLEAIIRM